MGRAYQISPIGIANHAWCNQPDVKFNTEGLYHTGLILDGQEAQDFKDTIDALVETAFEEEQAKMVEKGAKPAELKKWTRYHPYSILEDEDGKPTGKVEFKFKQNAKIRQKDGTMKAFKLGVRDGNDKATPEAVFGGDSIRVMWSARNALMSGIKQIGARLDFSMVQIVAKRERAGGGFGQVEGAWTDEQTGQGGDAGTANAADY